MIRIITLLILLVLAPHAMAVSIFNVPSTDQSLLFLGELFGPVGNIISGNPTNPLLVAIGDFNSAILAVGGFIILYALIVSTLNTAHDGEMLGKKWNSVWIPIRMAGGFAALLPVKAGGAIAAGKATLASYSLIQIFIMWIVVQGVGAADYVWAHYLQNVTTGQSRPQTISVPESVLQQAASAFQNAACMYTHVNYVNEMNKEAPDSSPVKTKVTYPSSAEAGNIVSWGTENPTAIDLCGSALLKNTTSTDKKNKGPGLPQVSASMLTSLTNAAQAYVSGNYCDNNTNASCMSGVQRQIMNAANNFVQSNLAYTTSYEGNQATQENIKQAEGYGWLYTGAYYMLLSKVSAQTSPVLIMPSVTPFNPGKISDYTTNPHYASIAQVATICGADGASTQQGLPCIPKSINTAGPASTMDASYVKVKGGGILNTLINWINSLFRAIFDGFVFLLTGTNSNPIVSLAQFGQGMVAEAGLTFVGIGVAVSAIALGTGWVPFIGNATVGAAQVAITWFAPVAAGAVGAIMIFCGLIGFYLPLVPYILFTVGVIAWFGLVIEAMIAGPIIALGIIHPEGQHDIWGRSEKGVMLLLSIFLRPVLMVIGFIAASLMIYIIIELVNGGFKVAFSVGGGFFGPFALFFTIGVYTTMLIFLFQRAFALIYDVPDKVLRWIGEAPEQMSSEGKEMIGKAEQGNEKAGGGLAEGVGSGSKGVSDMAGESERQKGLDKKADEL